MKGSIFETSEFSMPINMYVKMIILSLLMRWFWLLASPIVLCVILAIFVSYKFVLVALMILFLILPFVLMMVYFYYSSTQEAQISILKKRMEITHEGIIVYFSPILRHKYDTDEEDEYFAPKECFIGREEVIKVENMGNKVVIYLAGNRCRIISIPLEVVKGDSDEFLAYILQYNN
jgi:membrane protein implicated in regulation of membrane protease activity